MKRNTFFSLLLLVSLASNPQVAAITTQQFTNALEALKKNQNSLPLAQAAYEAYKQMAEGSGNKAVRDQLLRAYGFTTPQQLANKVLSLQAQQAAPSGAAAQIEADRIALRAREREAEQARQDAVRKKRQLEDAEAAARKAASDAERAKRKAEQERVAQEQAKRKADLDRANQEAKKQAEAAQRQADEAKRKADDAQRQAEEAKRKAAQEEAAKKQADAARIKAEQDAAAAKAKLEADTKEALAQLKTEATKAEDYVPVIGKILAEAKKNKDLAKARQLEADGKRELTNAENAHKKALAIQATINNAEIAQIVNRVKTALAQVKAIYEDIKFERERAEKETPPAPRPQPQPAPQPAAGQVPATVDEARAAARELNKNAAPSIATAQVVLDAWLKHIASLTDPVEKEGQKEFLKSAAEKLKAKIPALDITKYLA